MSCRRSDLTAQSLKLYVMRERESQRERESERERERGDREREDQYITTEEDFKVCSKLLQ